MLKSAKHKSKQKTKKMSKKVFFDLEKILILDFFVDACVILDDLDGVIVVKVRLNMSLYRHNSPKK